MSPNKKINCIVSGFTLLEVMVALFIFTIVSLILVTTLHSVLTSQKATEQHAERLARIQLALLLFSRDTEQVVNRPITTPQGSEEPALVGSTTEVTFTHTGRANPLTNERRTTLQRARYTIDHHQWIRTLWPVLDPTIKTNTEQRVLLTDVNDIQFTYLNNKKDKVNTFENRWPIDSAVSQPTLPKAIRILIVFNNGEKITQLYLLPGYYLANT